MKTESVSQIDRTAEGKCEFAARFSVSKRTVDSWLARGCPHLKLSSRCVRLPVAEAEAWVKENYFTQRRSKPEKV
jgi:hypothetical protein